MENLIFLGSFAGYASSMSVEGALGAGATVALAGAVVASARSAATVYTLKHELQQLDTSLRQLEALADKSLRVSNLRSRWKAACERIDSSTWKNYALSICAVSRLEKIVDTLRSDTDAAFLARDVPPKAD